MFDMVRLPGSIASLLGSQVVDLNDYYPGGYAMYSADTYTNQWLIVGILVSKKGDIKKLLLQVNKLRNGCFVWTCL